MATAEVHIKGIALVAKYDYMPADNDTGWGDEAEVNAVFVLGNDEVVDDDEDKDILGLLSNETVLLIEEACLIASHEYERQGEQP